MEANQKIKQLQEIIPFKFRIGNGMGGYEIVGKKKVYKKYNVLAYIDARDVMDRLDEIFPGLREREDYVLNNVKHCKIGIEIDGKVRRRSDVGTKSQTSPEKGEASDAFKRAAVNRGIGRFLYTLPMTLVTAEEADEHKYRINQFIRQKYKDTLMKRAQNHKVKLDDLQNKYNEGDEADLPEGGEHGGQYTEKLKGEFPKNYQPGMTEEKCKEVYFNLLKNNTNGNGN